MFSGKYLKYCFFNGIHWIGKLTFVGDWFIDLEKTKLNVVSQDLVDKIDFSSGKYAYVPDLDDLFELIDNQVKAWGNKVDDKKIKIEYKNREWNIEVWYQRPKNKENGYAITYSCGESLHEALSNAIIQMSVVVDDERFEKGNCRKS